jgi:hypothetical protein
MQAERSGNGTKLANKSQNWQCAWPSRDFPVSAHGPHVTFRPAILGADCPDVTPPVLFRGGQS